MIQPSKKKTKKKRIALIGATGMVGRELIDILEDHPDLVASLELFASDKSAGEIIAFRDETLLVKELKDADQINADIAFFAAGAEISKKYIELLSARGIICIDKSSAFRYSDDVCLIASKVNDDAIKNSKIIAVPNCVATPLVQVLSPLHKLAILEQVVVSTYQAVSGVGKNGPDELETQVRDLFNYRDLKTDVFGQRIAFNVLPYIPAHSLLDELGKTDEEAKIIFETKKILGLENLKIEVTCVRVPVFNGHSMALNIATQKPIKITDVLDCLKQTPGIIVVEEDGKKKYPTPLDACGKDQTLVGRIRPNTSVVNGISLWITSDNLRTGAALNAVRIAETISLE